MSGRIRSDRFILFIVTPLVLEVEELPTPLGVLLLVSRQDSLYAVEWKDCEARMHRPLRGATLVPREARSGAHRALERYFTGDVGSIDALAVQPPGTPFQCAVWRALRDIPAGETSTYGALAHRLGRPTAARAVGAANGANPLSVVVPCHRLVGADGALTGYAGGLARKRWLLDHERNALPPRSWDRVAPRPSLPA